MDEGDSKWAGAHYPFAYVSKRLYTFINTFTHVYTRFYC